LKLVESDGSNNAGPRYVLDRNSTSPAISDEIGDVVYSGRNSTGESIEYARAYGKIIEVADGNEGGGWNVQTYSGGTNGIRLRVQAGVLVGDPTGGDRGVGTVNSSAGYYVNGVLLTSGSGSTSHLRLDATDNSTALIHLQLAENSSAVGPTVLLDRNSASPAVADELGEIRYVGRTSASSSVNYARIVASIVNPANNSEGGEIEFQTYSGGSNDKRLSIQAGIIVASPTGGDKGAGTINAAASIYVNNVPLSTSTGNMFGANNLSDVSNAASARSNIGAGTVTSVGASSPITTSGGNTPTIGINLAVPGAIGGTTPSTGTFTQIFTVHGVSNTHVIRAHATHATYAANCIVSNVTRAANTGYNFFTCYSGNLGDVEFILRGDGHAFADNNWNAGGADYAEYFEWEDANPSDFDRRGIAVIMDGDKIREAEDGEIPFGIISGNPSVVGNAAALKWERKYLRDDFGTRRLT
jgi:hypothetical protein